MPKVRIVPLRRTYEKQIIWNRHQQPVGFKFYATYKKTKGSALEHGEFSVVVSKKMPPRAMAFLVRSTVRRMITDRELPADVDYKTYDGFIKLHGQEWQKVHKVLYYNVNHTRT